MKTVYRVAVLGCGAISGNHLAALKLAGQEICALCDILPERAESRKAEYGLTDAKVYTDWHLLLEREKPDCVHICLPHDLHAPVAAEALRRNVNVLCEKPLAITLEGLREVLQAERESAAMLGVCLQNRYVANMRRLREYAAHGVEGAAGTVIWKRDADYYATGAWRGTWEQEGGGVMINQALHTLDLLQWICGMPAYVTAHCANDHLCGVIETEDTASALFETADGTRLSFFATTAGGADLPVQLLLHTSQKETVTAANKYFIVNGQALESAPEEPIAGKTVWGSGHKKLIADFYDHLARGEHFPIDGPEAAKVVRLILGMYASNGKRIPVPQL